MLSEFRNQRTRARAGITPGGRFLAGTRSQKEAPHTDSKEDSSEVHALHHPSIVSSNTTRVELAGRPHRNGSSVETSSETRGSAAAARYNEAMPPKTQPASASSPVMPDAIANPEKGASFEKGLEQLEQIVRELERGDMALEESIRLFERGIELTESCRKQLEYAETRVEILRGKSAAKPSESGQLADTDEDSSDGADNDEDVPF